MPDRECASPVPIAGVISGGGITPTGETIVTVDVEVSGDCYDTIIVGDEWPPRATACS